MIVTWMGNWAPSMTAVGCVGSGWVGHVGVSLWCLWVASAGLVADGWGRTFRRGVWGDAFTHFPWRLWWGGGMRAAEFFAVPWVWVMRSSAYWCAWAAWSRRFWARWWAVNSFLFGCSPSRRVLWAEFLFGCFWLWTFKRDVFCSFSMLQHFWAHGSLQYCSKLLSIRLY